MLGKNSGLLPWCRHWPLLLAGQQANMVLSSFASPPIMLSVIFVPSCCSVGLPGCPQSFLLSRSSTYPASSASALQPGLLVLPLLCIQFSASTTSVIFTAWCKMYQAKGMGSRHRQGIWAWSWTWQMLLPLPQGQAHPRMGRLPLPLQVDTMPSACIAWSHSQWRCMKAVS